MPLYEYRTIPISKDGQMALDPDTLEWSSIEAVLDSHGLRGWGLTEDLETTQPRTVILQHINSYFVNLNAEDISGDSGFLLVDLDNVTDDWPHTITTEHIGIELVWININPETGFRGEVSIGVIECPSITATVAITGDGAALSGNCDFHVLKTWFFSRNVAQVAEFAPLHPLHLSGEAEYWFGPTVVAEPVFVMSTPIQGPDGEYYTVGDGDIVMKIECSTPDNPVSVSVCISYHVHVE